MSYDSKGWRWFDRNYGLIVWGLILVPAPVALIVTVILIVVT